MFIEARIQVFPRLLQQFGLSKDLVSSKTNLAYLMFV